MEILIAGISAGISFLSVFIATISLYKAGQATNINKRMFRRQGIIDLHMAWSGVNELDLKNVVIPDVVKAVNALDLTAALWNHDVIEKVILYQSYWNSFSVLYETLNDSNRKLPKSKKKYKKLLTPEMKRAYEDMYNSKYQLDTQTTLDED